jgi:CRISPR/Cas system-associated endonuclease/helicase Cas3
LDSLKLLGIVLVAAVSVVVWRLQYQANWQRTDDKIMALLESAEQRIQANREDEAEAVAKQGLGLLPGDARCQKMIERINAKRQITHQRKTDASNAALAQAEQLAENEITSRSTLLKRWLRMTR